MNKVWVMKIIKPDSRKAWMEKGTYFIVQKDVFNDTLIDSDMECKVVHKLKAEEGMYSYYHYADTLTHLINRQEGAIKSALTCAKRIPTRKKMIKALIKLRKKDIKERAKWEEKK